MRIMIVTASRHLTTHEVGDHLAADLAAVDPGLEVTTCCDPADARVAGVDGVVLGSPLYGGRWLRGARSFLRNNASSLAAVQLWTFSCALGKPSGSPGESPATATLNRRVEHVHLGGRLDLAGLNTAERAVVRGLGLGDCDTRVVDDRERFAVRIARQVG